jgi:hypothetical protein
MADRSAEPVFWPCGTSASPREAHAGFVFEGHPRALDIESADPVVELPRQAGQSPAWHSKQRLDLVRRQLHSE